MRIDKEATERIIKNALGSQLKEDQQKLKSTKKNMMSDSESSDSESEEEGEMKKKSSSSAKVDQKKAPPKKLARSTKYISKDLKSVSSKKTASRKDMHGATVVPIAAHLKYKELLSKK